MTSKSETKPIKILLVDDHEVLRIGLRTLFTEAGKFPGRRRGRHDGRGGGGSRRD